MSSESERVTQVLDPEDDSYMCDPRRGGGIVVGVQFEARDVDRFLEVFEQARVAVERLGEESDRTAEQLERLSRANKGARRALYRPWWMTGAGQLAGGGWLTVLVATAMLAAGTEQVGWVLLTLVLGLAVGIVASSVASTSCRKPRQ